MKKKLLFVSTLLISTLSFSQYENFEDWTQNSVITLDKYQTSANEAGTLGSASTYRITDAVTGTYAIKLETTLTPDNDTIFGFCVSGDPEGSIPGQAVTITGAIDSVIGWYKYDIMPNDSAAFMVQTTGGGNTTGGGVYYIKGQQATWKRFAFPVQAPAADSLLIAAASSDALNDYNGVPGTWIQFDDIQLKGPGGTMNIVNHSFENWTPITWDNLDGWVTANQYAFNEPTMPAVKSTDKYAGNFALQLTTITTNRGDTINGVASNGNFNESGFAGGAPYTASPSSVEFYYKNTISGVDTSFLAIEFKNGGTTILQSRNQLDPASTYTLFTQPISLGSTPDSVLIGLFSGEKSGSQLFIDNLSFVFPIGIAEGLTVEKLVAYPNPVTDVLKIKFNLINNNQVTIRLIDALGKELTKRFLGNISTGTYRESFNTSNFSNGVYFVEFTLGNEKMVERFIVK